MSLADTSGNCLFPVWYDSIGFLPCGHCFKCLEKKGKKVSQAKIDFDLSEWRKRNPREDMSFKEVLHGV